MTKEGTYLESSGSAKVPSHGTPQRRFAVRTKAIRHAKSPDFYSGERLAKWNTVR